MSVNPNVIARKMFAAALLLQCAGCMVGPDFSSPSTPVAADWLESRDPSVKSASLIAPEHREDWAWWTVFHDPVLDRLIRVAYEQNLSLVSAGTRALEARAELGVAIGEFYPQLQHGTGSIIYSRESHADATATSAGVLHNFWRDALGLTINWETGLLGQVPPRAKPLHGTEQPGDGRGRRVDRVGTMSMSARRRLWRGHRKITCLSPPIGDRESLAHGRDPNFPGWPDTLQLNYANPELQAARIDELVATAGKCDGVRCDMAMLLLLEASQWTWGITPGPFWPKATARGAREIPRLHTHGRGLLGPRTDTVAAGLRLLL